MSTVAVPSHRRLVALLSVISLLSAFLPTMAAPVRGVGDPWINEIHYDNTGTDTGEAIEIAGPAGTDLSAYSIVLYNGNGGAPYTPAPVLSGVISDQQNGFGTLSFDAPGLQNGSPDGIALMSGSAIVQFVSYEGSFVATSGPAAGTASGDIGVSESGSGAAGNSLQLTGNGTAYGEFTWATEGPNTFGSPNTGQTFGTVTNQPVTANCGAALTLMEGAGGTRTVTATDPDGIVTSIALTGFAPSDPGTISIGTTTAATEVGGTASAAVTIGTATPPGTYDVTITATNSDAAAQTDDCTLAVSVQEVLTIGEVQGIVEDGTDGHAHVSPYVGQQVFVRGVITAHHGEGSVRGIYIQSTPGFSDGDARSSDGIFVFQSRFNDIRILGGGSYLPVVGDEVILRGAVGEFFNMTQLGSVFLSSVVETGVALPTATEADPPSDVDEAGVYWERLEGMLVQVPAGSIVQGGRDVFGTVDGELWFVRGDSVWAERGAYARRVFRDPHPLDDVSEELFDNGNGDRILVGSSGLQGAARVAGSTAVEDRVIAPGRTFDVSTNAPIGPLNYSFGKYRIEVTTQVELTPGIDPSLNAPPVAPHRTLEYSSGVYNVENLYDFRNDPFDGCDFAGDAGCPGVRPPFNYVPTSEADYQAHLAALADQIVTDLHAPDILLIQEAEDQDICFVDGASLDCDDGVDDRDGKPDTLQDLALTIAAAGGPTYDAAYDRNGADDRGIVSAFMYRTDRVELLPPAANDPVLGSSPAIAYDGASLPYNAEVQNPKALNAVLPAGLELGDECDELEDGRCVFTRDPQVGLFRVWRGDIGSSVFIDVYAVSNHFSSRPDDPERRQQRIEQARYNAAIAAALLETDLDARVITGGDFNVFPRPDEPFPADPSDQLGPLYELGLHDLWGVVAAEVPEAAYSYVFEGQAQTLDNQFVSPELAGELNGVRFAHVNADWPARFDGDGSRGASDHDPQIARFDALTCDALANLVDYLAEAGEIEDDFASGLANRFDLCSDFVERGQAERAQQQVELIEQLIQRSAGRQVSEEAAQILLQEIELLLIYEP